MSLEQTLKNDFEQWAHLSAKLRLCTPLQHDQLLMQLGLTEVWESVHEAWYRTLNEEIAHGQLDRPKRYKDICLEEASLASTSASDFRDELSPFRVRPATDQQGNTWVPDGPATTDGSKTSSTEEEREIWLRLTQRAAQKRRVVPPARGQIITGVLSKSDVPIPVVRDELTPNPDTQRPTPSHGGAEVTTAVLSASGVPVAEFSGDPTPNPDAQRPTPSHGGAEVTTAVLSASDVPMAEFRDELTPNQQIQRPTKGQDETANTNNERIRKLDEAAADSSPKAPSAGSEDEQ